MNDNDKKYFNTPDENFKMALSLISEDMSENKLFEMLKCGNVPEKQIAALRISAINSVNEAKIFLDNLTGQDGKVREAVALRINEFMSCSNMREYFRNIESVDVFLEAIIDINGNICRNIINAVSRMSDDIHFVRYFTQKLLLKIRVLIESVKDFDFQDGKYKVNKEVFKLYWCLEALYEFATQVNISELKPILTATAVINDYTIREKTAKILTLNFDDKDLDALRQALKHDKNYYVRRF